MDLQVQCISKTERMEGQNVVADVALQPYTSNVPTPMAAAPGAQIGTPNAPAPADAQAPATPPTMTISGGFTLQIRDAEEAARYKVGQVYTINLGVSSTSSAPKTNK